VNFHAFSGLLNGLAATISGILVYAKNPTDPKHQAYGMYALAAAIWGYGYWAWQISSSHDSALFYVRLLMVGAIATTFMACNRNRPALFSFESNTIFCC
jgi:hypothetical protein